MRTCTQCFMSFYFNSPPAVLAPSQVTGVSLSKAVENRQPALKVNWTAPQSDVIITRYKVEYRVKGSTPWNNQINITGSPPLNFTILTGLYPDTEYEVRVKAVSDAGEGAWSAVQSERTFSGNFKCVTFCYRLHVHFLFHYHYCCLT